MAYFRNRAVNLLNLHYGIHAAALSGGGAFYFVYFLKNGFSPATVLVFVAAVLLGRFLMRPFILPAGVRWGVRRLLIVGTLVGAIQYPLLAEVVGVGPLLYALCILAAIGDTIYWTSYHAYFAALGDQEHRGHQLGAREALTTMVGIISPLATGLILVAFGPRWAFGLTAVVQILAAVPMLGTPDVSVRREAAGVLKTARPAMLLFLADGWIQTGYLIVWQMGLFLSLGENYVSYGGALAMAALVGAAGGMVLGRSLDSGHGLKAVWVAMGLLMFVIAMRAASLGHPSWAVAANALGALVNALYMPTFMTAVYTPSKQSPCPLRFQMATEGSWDAGGASAALVMALLISRGVSLSAVILISLLGAVGSLIILRRYYAGATPADAAAAGDGERSR